MKKTLVFFCLAAAFLAGACTRIAVEGPAEPKDGYVVIKAGLETDPSTRTALGEGNTVRFVEGDELAVFNEDGMTCKFTMMTGSPYPDGSADFQGQIGSTTGDGNLRLFAMYPYQSGAYVGSSARTVTEIYATVPRVQYATAGSFDPEAALCVGKTVPGSGTATAALALHNVCALLKVSIPDDMDYKKLVISSGDAFLGGTVRMQMATSSGSFQSASASLGGEGGPITLMGPFEGGVDYYVAAIPGEYNGLTAALYDSLEEGAPAVNSKTTTKKVTLSSGKIAKLGTLPDIYSGPWDGKGTPKSPFLISSLADLRRLAEAFSTVAGAEALAGCCFRQTADIDCNGESIMIGSERYESPSPDSKIAYFESNYDGGGHLIENYTLESHYPSIKYRSYGLFHTLRNCTISNLHVKPATTINISTISSLNDCDRIGFLAANTAGGVTIDHVVVDEESYTVEIPVTDSGNHIAVVGGLVGEVGPGNGLTITSCDNHASLTITGGQYSLESENTYGNCVGGLVGHMTATTSQTVMIDRCRNYGLITDSSYKGYVSSAGGLVGAMIGNGANLHMSNCVNYAKVHSYNQITSSASVNGYSYAGGMVGYHDREAGSGNAYVYNCLNKGDIYSHGNDAASGGIMGFCRNKWTQIALCVNTGYISGEGDPHNGGMCGIGVYEVYGNYGPTCITCYWLKQGDTTLPCCSSGSEFYDCHGDKTSIVGMDISAFRSNDYVNKKKESYWDGGQWLNNTVPWTGSTSPSNTLDLDF